MTSASARAATRTNGTNQPEPKLIDKREQVLDPLTAYQITSIMEGVIQRGTGQAIKAVGKHLAGKTGTTNEAKDLWFVGYLARSRGRRLHRLRPAALARAIRRRPRSYAAPIFRDFMKMALKDKPDVPFRVPPGIKLISVDRQDRHARRAAPARSWKRSSPAPRRPTPMRPAMSSPRAQAGDRRCGPACRHGHGRACIKPLAPAFPCALRAAMLHAVVSADQLASSGCDKVLPAAEKPRYNGSHFHGGPASLSVAHRASFDCLSHPEAAKHARRSRSARPNRSSNPMGLLRRHL